MISEWCWAQDRMKSFEYYRCINIPERHTGPGSLCGEHTAWNCCSSSSRFSGDVSAFITQIQLKVVTFGVMTLQVFSGRVLET